jgi:hypothetical protein
LKGFKEREAPRFYEASHWEVDGLDARIRLAAELPGDFTAVEDPFLAMVKAASCGVVDYFEDGSKKNQTQGRDPVKRWDRHAYDKLPKLMTGPIFELGTGVVGFSSQEDVVLVHGTLRFRDEAAASVARSPAALPYLTETDVREVRIAATGSGCDVTFFVAVRAPVYKKASVLEAPIVAWARAISIGSTGALSVEAPFGNETSLHTIEGGAESSRYERRAVKALEGMSVASGEVVTPTFGNG